MGTATNRQKLIFSVGGLVVLGLWWFLKRINSRDEVQKKIVLKEKGSSSILNHEHSIGEQGTAHLSEPIVFQDSLAPALLACVEKITPRPEVVIPRAVSVIHGLLSREECAALIEAAKERGFAPPPLFAAEVRGCERRHTVDRGISEFVMTRLRPYLPEIVVIDGARWQLLRFTHHWRYVRYFEGGGFIPHWDGAKMLPDHEMSVFTVQVYLNDNFTGGSTRFYGNYKFTPLPSHDIKYGEAVLDVKTITEPHSHTVRAETGTVLVFDHAGNSLLHDGEMVTNGPKFILRGDVMYRALREDVPLLLKQECLTWCPQTAARSGTRNAMGQVWICWCAVDSVGSCKQCVDSDGLRQKDTSKRKNDSGLITILISGKRCAGKDHIASLIESNLRAQGRNVFRAAIGDANKKLYAQKTGINLERLRNDREFKESHRISMIDHHSQKSKENPVWSEEMVLQEAKQAQASVLLVSDIRTRKGLEYFENCGGSVYVLRVHASDEARRNRGWVYDAVKDNLYTEVELDDYLAWTACVDNSDDSDIGAHLLSLWVNNTVIPRVLV